MRFFGITVSVTSSIAGTGPIQILLEQVADATIISNNDIQLGNKGSFQITLPACINGVQNYHFPFGPGISQDTEGAATIDIEFPSADALDGVTVTYWGEFIPVNSP